MEIGLSIAALVISILSGAFSLYTFLWTAKRDRKQATLEAYNRLQAEVFDHLNTYRPAEICDICTDKKSEEYKVISGYLARIEHFCVGINQGIYDKNTFFALPPNSRTKPGNFHGIYYVKLFPIIKKYVQPYLYEGDTFLTKVVNIIDTNDDTIIKACQDYLNEYIKGNRNAYTPDIDAIIELLDNEENNKDTN